MQDLIDKQSAINTIKDADVCICYSENESVEVENVIDLAIRATKRSVIASIEQLPSAQPEITPDGTLHVSIDADIANVGRILLSQAGTQRGGLYYKDEQPEIIRCRDCKFYTPLNRETKSGICSLLIHQNFGDDWYCAGAERRADE